MPDTGLDWRAMLRQERRLLHVTQYRLAKAANLSPETIRKYENGQRSPTRESLARILEALQFPAVRSRQILAATGFAAPDRLFPADEHPDYFFTIDEARAAIEQTPWPQFVAGSAMDIVAADRAARLLLAPSSSMTGGGTSSLSMRRVPDGSKCHRVRRSATPRVMSWPERAGDRWSVIGDWMGGR